MEIAPCWRHKQLFRQRLSHIIVYATMSIGIMGSKSLVLLDWVLRWFSNLKEKAWIHVLVLFPSTTLKHLEVQSSNSKTTITHSNFRHCRVGFSSFVRQPYSKQLYTRGSTHMSWTLAWMLSRCLWDSLADFSQRWRGIRQGLTTRGLICRFMLWANGKGEFFRVENKT